MRARDQSSIFSIDGKFRPDYGLLLELHALTLVARSYALLLPLYLTSHVTNHNSWLLPAVCHYNSGKVKPQLFHTRYNHKLARELYNPVAESWNKKTEISASPTRIREKPLWTRKTNKQKKNLIDHRGKNPNWNRPHTTIMEAYKMQ